MADKSLKSKNWKTLASILILDAVIICALISGDSLKHLFDATPSLSSQIAKSALVSSIATLVALIGSFLVPANVKAMLVFTRIRNALPGHRASRYASSDPRLDVSALESRIGRFPDDPKEQNVLWYRLMKKHEKDASVADSHQMFLLLRDASALSLLLCLVLIFSAVLRAVDWTSASHALMFAGVQFVVTIIAARNAGARFVTNVLVQESLSPAAQEKSKGK